MLRLHLFEDGRDPAERGRHPQQPERMPGRRRVHDDLRILPGLGEARQLEQPDELVDAREREPQQRIDVVIVEIGSAPDDLLECHTPLPDPAVQRAIGIELDHVERPRNRGPWAGSARDARPGDRHAARQRGEPLVEHVSERMRRIRGDEEDASPGLRRHDSGTGGAGGLTDAPLAAEESEPWSTDRDRRRGQPRPRSRRSKWSPRSP
jgi:hypothetical protein